MASAITLNNLNKTHTHITAELLVSEAAWKEGQHEVLKIPDNDDDKIKQVPSAAYVGAGVHD